MSYDNNMRGIISKNDKKTEDKHPDIRGNCEIDGAEYRISGWLKERKDGTGKFYSLVFQPRESVGNAPVKPQSALDGLDDDLPF